MKKVTIQDIARVAGVSKSTVSRVLNDSQGVHPDKKKAVLEATQRLGFKPNIVAQSLARGQSMTIGVLTQLIGSPFYDAIAQGVIMGLGDTNYSPIFFDGQLQKETELEGIRALIGRSVDGLVLVGGGVPGEELADLCQDLPTVVVARQLASDRHRCLFMDNLDGGFQATKHLIDKGHQAIAIFRGHDRTSDSRDRFLGYQQALREAGLPLKDELIRDGDFSADSGIQCMNQLLDQDIQFTALFATNDMMAYGARLALYRRGIRVPEEISIIGFDDQMESAYTTPPLTTIHQPAREMGEQASKAVLAIIKNQPFTLAPVQGKLIERESVKPIN